MPFLWGKTQRLLPFSCPVPSPHLVLFLTSCVSSSQPASFLYPCLHTPPPATPHPNKPSPPSIADLGAGLGSASLIGS